MAQPTVRDLLLHRFAEWGVRRVYGYPGSALIKRDPDSLGILIAPAKDWWHGVFPPRK